MRIINLTGIVGTDAVQKLTQGGAEYISFRFVNNEPMDEKDSEGKSKGFWVNVVSYNPIHKKIIQYLVKGKHLLVTGTLDENIYTSKVTGQCEIGRTIRAHHIEFLSSGQQKQEETTTTTGTKENEMPMVTGVDKKTSIPATKETSDIPVDDNDDDDLPF